MKRKGLCHDVSDKRSPERPERAMTAHLEAGMSRLDHELSLTG